MSRERPRLVVLDIDGCLTGGEAEPWDFPVMESIARMNRHARDHAHGLAVTLCTGRQQPYVEAVMQAIDGHMPAIFENGAGMYFPKDYRVAWHPELTEAVRGAVRRVKQRLETELVRNGIAQFQPGKEETITLYPAKRGSIGFEELAVVARRALEGDASAQYVTVTASVTSVEILPVGMHKHKGVEWLSHETGIALAAMGGIGDAAGDLTFLQVVGRSAAPANATPVVKGAVEYVSPLPSSRAVHDILQRWLRES